jgi:uncharacterized membrane protein YczE
MTPLEQLHAGRTARRLAQLAVGLVLYGVSMAMMLRSGLGLDPWDVFHSGIAQHLQLSFGTIVIIVGALVLLLWWPLRQWPGFGTVANVFVIGLATDATLAVLDAPRPMAARAALLVGGIVLNGLAGALYIGSQFGPGPRDGLMTGLVRRTGRSFRLVRTSLELTVLATGWLLGGVVGVGTVLYALLIGPVVQVFLPLFTVPLDREPSGATATDAASVDAASTDAASTDAASIDAGSIDAGSIDVAFTDAGTTVAESRDSAPLDAPSGVEGQDERQHGRGTGRTQRLGGHGEGPARARHVVDEQHGPVQPAGC